MSKLATIFFMIVAYVILISTVFLPYQAQVPFAAFGLAILISIVILRDA